MCSSAKRLDPLVSWQEEERHRRPNLTASLIGCCLLLSLSLSLSLLATAAALRQFLAAVRSALPERASTMAAQLEDVPNEALFGELLRRMKCASKSEKRLILVGITLRLIHYIPLACRFFDSILLSGQ